MTMYSSRLARLRISGLSLMELLIALLIGSILIVGVIQVFLASMDCLPSFPRDRA